MGMKTILALMEKHDGMQSMLETALLLARRYGSYVEGVPLRWATPDLPLGDIVVAFPVEHYGREIAAEAQRARRTFETFMQKNNVPRSTTRTTSLSFGWLNEPPGDETFVGNYGRAFDVIVMNRPDANSSVLYHRVLESALFESGRPLLLCPPSPPGNIGTNVLIAWNGSTEQARAVALSMPLLERAERVTVLTVTGGTGVPGPSAEQMIRYLQRNDVPSESLTVALDGKNTGEAILSAAQTLACDLLIKGAFTQSRLRQMIFGGATQHVMAAATLPVLLAH
ncbi:MAG TPA: universal stress protein [Pseudolabrys sp.]|nr:universal stress protein [Pseudolabrys sp.]